VISIKSKNKRSNIHFELPYLPFLWPERAPPRQSGIGGVKGHNINDNTLSGSPNLWAGSFKFELGHLKLTGLSLFISQKERKNQRKVAKLNRDVL